MELKQISDGATSFECQGKKYFVHKTLSFNRFEKLKEFSLEFGYSADIKTIMLGLRKAWDFINISKFADTAVQLHNLMSSIVNLEQKTDVSIRIAALFISEESEDTTVYDENLMKEKIDLWGKEYDVTFFFIFAISVVPSFLPVYKIVTQDFSLKNNLIEKIVNDQSQLQNFTEQNLKNVEDNGAI